MLDTVIITETEAETIRTAIKNLGWDIIEKTAEKEKYAGAMHIVVLKKVNEGYEYTLTNKTYLFT
jgi:hypothetical protein